MALNTNSFFHHHISSTALSNGADLCYSKSEEKEANLGKILVFSTFRLYVKLKYLIFFPT